MRSFPTNFGVEVADLSQLDLGPLGNDYLAFLGSKGLRVQLGIEPSDLDKIREIAGTEAAREFCPNDQEIRFKDEKTTRDWLEAGKAVPLLKANHGDALAGYGWTGPKTSEKVPGGDTTFATRLAPEFSGKKLATPFTGVTVALTQALFGRRDIWLETWGSNTAAVRAYLHAHAQLVATADAYRPTLRPSENETDGHRRDVRLFMRFITSKYLINHER